MSRCLNRDMKRYLVIENSSRDIEISRNSFIAFLKNKGAEVDCLLYFNVRGISLSNYDVIFIFRIEALLKLSLKLLLNRSKIKVIITGLGRYRSSGIVKYLIFMYLYALQLILGRNNFDIIYQNSQDSVEFMGESKVVLGSGIEVSPDARARERTNEVVKLAYAGRFLKSKGILKFLSLTDNRDFNEFEFHLAGRASKDISLNILYPYLDKKNVLFLGYLADLTEFYNSIDIFIFPSVYGEGFPRVILDCINKGVPFIVRRSNYTDDINLSDEIMSKLVLDKWESEVVLDSINYILSNYSSLSEEIWKIRANYSNETIFNSWLS